MIDQDILVSLSTFAPALPLGIGLMFLKRLGRDQQILVGIIGFSLVVEILAHWIATWRTSNLPLLHLYAPIEFIAFAYIYKLWLSEWWGKKVFDLGIIGFVAFSVINTLFFQSIDQWNSNAILMKSVLLMILSIAFFYRVLDQMSIDTLSYSPRFWINVSVFLYYSGSLLMVSYTNFIFNEINDGFLLIWYFHTGFNILHYLLFGIGLWLRPERQN